ncbi:protein of unknown function [Burkholderia multivorans]
MGEVGRNCIIVTVAALWGTDLTRIKRSGEWRLPAGMQGPWLGARDGRCYSRRSHPRKRSKS